MTQLTRRPDNDPQRPGGWFVYWGDVCVGHIKTRAGVPIHAPQWSWSCGFYPGCDPTQSTGGTAETFEEARAGFERDWERLLPTRTEEHFEEWRRSRDWHAWLAQMHKARLPLPTQLLRGKARCFCGAEIERDCEQHVVAAHRGIGA